VEILTPVAADITPLVALNVILPVIGAPLQHEEPVKGLLFVLKDAFIYILPVDDVKLIAWLLPF
jgi:hypothetical protein